MVGTYKDSGREMVPLPTQSVHAGAFFAVLLAVLNTVDVDLIVEILVTGLGVTKIVDAAPEIVLVLKIVTEDAGRVVVIVVVESADCVTVTVDCGTVTT